MVSALPGPTVINEHMRANILTPLEYRRHTNLWATGFYNYLNQDSGDRNVNFAVGADHWFGDRFFVGLAGIFSWPDYDSDDNDITGMLYGDATLPYDIDLSFFSGFGRTEYKQNRRSEIYRYSEKNTTPTTSSSVSVWPKISRWAITDV